MAYKHYLMDTSVMSAEHRDELLSSIRKCVGVGWWSMTDEPFVFDLTWDPKYDFSRLVTHADECALTPWIPS